MLLILLGGYLLLQAIQSQSARRALFERYVKTRAEEERKEKRAAQKAAIEGFKQLLEEVSEVQNLFGTEVSSYFTIFFFVPTLIRQSLTLKLGAANCL